MREKRTSTNKWDDAEAKKKSGKIISAADRFPRQWPQAQGIRREKAPYSPAWTNSSTNSKWQLGVYIGTIITKSS
jgi:hypothetical protein